MIRDDKICIILTTQSILSMNNPLYRYYIEAAKEEERVAKEEWLKNREKEWIK